MKNRRRLRKRKQAEPKSIPQQDYYNWIPGTKVRVLTGPRENYEAVIAGHNPGSNTFQVIFEDNSHDEYEPQDLREIHPDGKIINTPIENEPVIISSDDLEDLVNFDEEDQAEIHNESPQETLLRLAASENGFTLTELAEERKSFTKGPFAKTIQSALNKKLIKKSNWERKDEAVYKIKEDVEESATDKYVNFVEQSLSKNPPNSLQELGNLFIALGELLKKQ